MLHPERLMTNTTASRDMKGILTAPSLSIDFQTQFPARFQKVAVSTSALKLAVFFEPTTSPILPLG
jgi:hypothetical protein